MQFTFSGVLTNTNSEREYCRILQRSLRVVPICPEIYLTLNNRNMFNNVLTGEVMMIVDAGHDKWMKMILSQDDDDRDVSWSMDVCPHVQVTWLHYHVNTIVTWDAPTSPLIISSPSVWLGRIAVIISLIFDDVKLWCSPQWRWFRQSDLPRQVLSSRGLDSLYHKIEDRWDEKLWGWGTFQLLNWK